jgi:hypothetical protein
MDVRNDDANLDSQFPWTCSKCYTDRVLSLSLSLSLKGPVMNYDRLWLLGQNVWPMRWSSMAFNWSSLYTIQNLMMMMDEVRSRVINLYTILDVVHIHGTHMQSAGECTLRATFHTQTNCWCHPTKVLVRTNTSCFSKLVTSSWTRKSCWKVPHWSHIDSQEWFNQNPPCHACILHVGGTW